MDVDARTARFQAALERFVARLQEDRWVLGAVLVGTISRDTIWCRDTLQLWVIEADGVTRRRRADGDETRLFRTLVEDDLNIRVEVIARGAFKRMVEGASRTAFTHSFFALRTLLWTRDEAIERWFDGANKLAVKDQDQARLIATTWLIATHRHAHRLVAIKDDPVLAAGECIGMAWSLAAHAVIDAGIVYEDNILYWAMARDPDRFRIVYTDVLGGDRDAVRAAVAHVGALLEAEGEGWLAPVASFLERSARLMPLSELADHWAHSQLHPWHLEQACEWLHRQGRVQKLAVPYQLTKRSRTPVEEPAYQWDA